MAHELQFLRIIKFVRIVTWFTVEGATHLIGAAEISIFSLNAESLLSEMCGGLY